MLLTIDAGNTNTVFALIREGEIVEQWRISTRDQRTADEYLVWINQLMALHGHAADQVSGAIIASVVPQVVWPLTQLCKKYFHCEPMVVGASGVRLGIDINLPNPEEVGADRLVNAVAAIDLYADDDHQLDQALVIVDFGTATTFDVVSVKGIYEGGIICPGINLSLSALHKAAAKLPRIAVQPPKDKTVTGKSTLDAMQIGVYWGYISMIEGLIDRLKDEYGSIKVIATGGLAPVFAAHTAAIDVVDGMLTLTGLYKIYKKNC